MESDESDFYGDEETINALEHRVSAFNPTQWWKDILAAPPPLMSIKQEGEQEEDGRQFRNNNNIHETPQNPMEGLPFAWQTSETADAFTARLPPSSTIESPLVPCIYVCNPHAKFTARHADWQSLQSRGNEYESPEIDGAVFRTAHDGALERLDILHSFLLGLEKVRKPQSLKTRDANAQRARAVKDILHLSHACKVHSGKWMLVVDSKHIDQVWKAVVRATLENKLGVAAKVKPAADPTHGPPRKEHLVCVYTRDYADAADVERVILKLKDLKLLTAKPVYYKPDIYTYIGLAYNNKYGLRASLYSSTDLPLKK